MYEISDGLIVGRHATPYHAPLYLAQSKGYFEDEGIKVALLEPNDPSVRLHTPYPHSQLPE